MAKGFAMDAKLAIWACLEAYTATPIASMEFILI